MAKRRSKFDSNPTTQPDPLWPTTVRSRSRDGRISGIDNSVWVYRTVPMAPVTDARTPEEGLAAGDPIYAALDDIAATSHVSVARRSMAKGAYRQVHILLVNIPQFFKPKPGAALGGYLSEAFPHESTERRLLIVGVRLIDKVGGTGGFREAVDSVVETISTGSTPMSDFDKDFADIDAILSRSGLANLSAEDFRLANAWWNLGRTPDSPLLVHSDHLHIFGSAESVRVAASLEEGDCQNWPAIPRHHTVSIGCVQDFDLSGVDAASSAAQWASSMIDAGAVVVSIRGRLEPASVTRAELRRKRKQYIDDVTERAQQGKMERAEQEERMAELDEMERVYAIGGPPTLMDCSTLIAFTGRDQRTGYDLSDAGAGAGISVNSMVSRQSTALAETWIASPVRANPYLHDLPIHAVSSAGLAGLSMVGDADGAMLGFTERDRQPAYMSQTAAADEDSVPIFIGVGQSGSGKLIRLSTPIPTPSGWTTMGALSVGDEVLGSDGRPCRVTFLSPVEETPVLYDIHFSDGQVVTACKDHQWLVSNWQDRNKVRHPHRTNAIENWDSSQQLVEDLSHLASRFSDADMLTADELMAEMAHLDIPWRTQFGVSTALDFVDCPSEMDHREIVITGAKSQRVKTDPVVLFPVVAALQACREKWLHPGAANAARWGQDHFDGYVAAADTLIAATDPDEEATVADIARRLQGAGAEFLQSSRVLIASYARKAGIPGRAGHATVTVPIPDRYLSHPERRVWSAPLAFKSLAVRVSMMFAERPNTIAESRVLSTEEMVVAGVRQGVGQQAEFAVHVAEPLSLPRADLPVDPYVLGAWLGDGSSGGGGTITQGESESCTDEHGLTDRSFLIGQLVDAGVDASASTSVNKSINTKGLATKLRQAGVLHGKHIPTAYLRASADQRLSLLQGLMDTDGTVDKNGSCELCLCDERLITGALELIRSLGIKASISSGPAVITDPDPERPGHKRRRVTGTRWRIHFTTTSPVFRLPRKLDRLPEQVRETQQWIYIDKIVPVPTQPGRCITVNSPDHTYLVKGFIPTHNTVTMLYLADQFARTTNARGERTPVTIIDPKALTLETPIPTPDGMTTMGEIQPGDTIFGSDGEPCTVQQLSRVFDNPDLFEVTFDDGQVLHACLDHQWAVSEIVPPTDGRSAWTTLCDQVLTTEDLISRGASDGRFAIRVSGPLDLNERELSLDPYSVGLKIGSEPISVPAELLRASRRQRLLILQGIMDAEGVVGPDGSCRLRLPSERLLDEVAELIRTLGIKVTRSACQLSFHTDQDVFRYPMQPILWDQSFPDTARWHYIVSIEPIDSAPARCIVVDSPDHTYLAGQFIPTHNSGSDHSAAVLASGGSVASLDELAAADGIFDPMRFANRMEVGVELSASMLMSVNPWGTNRANFETPLVRALSYGAERGADCIGVALQMALADGVAPPEMVERVFDLSGASPMFRACVGSTQGGQRLRTAEGITLIKVGDAHLDLPEPGSTMEVTQPQRVALALVRMMVFGSAMALTGRQGVLMLDEAWVMLSAGRSEVERLGRLARSQQVFPMLWTQRITDASNAGLTGYISRGLILPISDGIEARTACELFKLEPTPERMGRITAKGTLGGSSEESSGTPNWSSMRALRDRATGKVLRGAVGIYVDLSGRAVPVEIKVPDSFFHRASTNPEDVRRRIAEEAERARAIETVEEERIVTAPGQHPSVLDDDILRAFGS